ncbi:TMEM165/GDT1 family protein [Candidatus Bipolaricaulota bacterium]|nr:TMEM165/GDT1 family protein [Candidatus Bipolaricaulota bacterium]
MWKIALSAFALVFLAELGDKTQLAALALSADSQRPWAVFLGASAALVLSTGIAVILGTVLHRIMPESMTRIIQYAAGTLFLVAGVLTLIRA